MMLAFCALEETVRKRQRSERSRSVSHVRSPLEQSPADQGPPVQYPTVPQPSRQHARRPFPVRPKRSRRSATLIRYLPVCAALLAAGVFLSWTDGGRTTRLSDPLAIQLDRLAEKAGLGLQEVTIGGHRRTKEEDIYAAIDLGQVRSFILFDSQGMRKRIESLPWINQAEIRQSSPWRVEVRVTERTPFALWRHQGSDIIIDRTGRHLETVKFGRVRSLPLVAGAGAEAQAHEILDAIAQWPDLLLATSLARRIGGRRWDLILSESRRIQLPARNFARALSDLMAGQRGRRLFDQQFIEADFRLPDQVTLRQRTPSGERYSSPTSVLSRSLSTSNKRNRS